MVPQICFLTFLGHFCRFPLQKIKKLKKWKKMEILSFYTHVPQMTTISYLWCMASEKWSATDITCCHFGSFYAPVLHYNSNFKNNEKKRLDISSFYTCVLQMTIIWCMVPEIWGMIYRTFCHFATSFAFSPS